MKTKTILSSFCLLAFFFIFSGCRVTCPDVACVPIIYPGFVFKITGANLFAINASLIRIDKSTNKPLDSAQFSPYGENTFNRWATMGNNGNYEIKDYNYILRTSIPSMDTLFEVAYTKTISDVACGKCSDGTNDNVKVTTYQNFNYKCKGKTYRDIDTLVIGK